MIHDVVSKIVFSECDHTTPSPKCRLDMSLDPPLDSPMITASMTVVHSIFCHGNKTRGVPVDLCIAIFQNHHLLVVPQSRDVVRWKVERLECHGAGHEEILENDEGCI